MFRPVILIFLLAGLFLIAGSSAWASSKVYVIDVHGTVWPVQATFVDKALDDAAQHGAAAVILDVDTFGGFAQSAVDIKDAVLKHDRDYVTVGYVHNRALSSGSLITLSCKYIAMGPGATLGSAQPHPGGGGDPDPETLSWARKEFASTADARKRNPNIATAWVTSPSAIPSLGIKEGDILTLTTQQAQANGYCDVVAADYPDILDFLKLPGSELVMVHLGFWETVGLFIVQPWVTILLLVIGLALVIWEMLTLHSWGLAGLIGGIVVATVLFAYIGIGAATWIGVALILLGVTMMLLETHILPTHGVLGLIGLICTAAGIYLALGGTNDNALFPASVSAILTVVLVLGFLYYLPKSPIWRIIGKPIRQRASAGYVSSADYTEYLGQVGTTLTNLRPSGMVEIDGQRLDVVTEGEFIDRNTKVEVFLIEGSRVVVRPLHRAEVA